jgi:sigma-B regulation protein RsbU (phosphoserine phosphatase)
VTVADVIGGALGTLYLTLGLAALGAAALRSHRRDRSLLWFGVFTALYGLRLLARSGIVQEVVPLPAAAWPMIQVVITYIILVPAALLASSALSGGWRGVLGYLWIINLAGAFVATAWDALWARAGVAMGLNRALVVGNIATAIFSISLDARVRRWNRDGWLLLGSASVFAAIAVVETVSGGILGPIDTEPVAMLLVVLALGYVIVTRVFRSEGRIAAVQRELETARRIQQSILPRRPPSAPGISIATHYQSMAEVAGDFFDFVVAPSGDIGILVADVSGHGVPAALVASMVKIALAMQEDFTDPGAVLTRMNRALYGRFELAYVTAVFARIGARGPRLAYASAGHPSPLLVRRDGRVEPLDERGIVLGLMPDAQYSTAIVPDLGPGDRLVLYTDGLTEAERTDGEFFGDRELHRVLAAGRSQPVASFVTALMGTTGEWVGGPFTDDVTVVAVDWS